MIAADMTRKRRALTAEALEGLDRGELERVGRGQPGARRTQDLNCLRLDLELRGSRTLGVRRLGCLGCCGLRCRLRRILRRGRTLGEDRQAKCGGDARAAPQ